jgi:hypothetical protein
MTVCAANIALGNLQPQLFYVADAYKPVHIRRLCGPIPVIEIKHHRVFLAAIYAWMSRKVFAYDPATRFTVALVTLSRPGQVCVTVALIVSSRVDTAAFPAVASQRAPDPVLDRKVHECLHHATHRAPPKRRLDLGDGPPH